MLYMGIDPGPTQSGVVLFDADANRVTEANTYENRRVLVMLGRADMPADALVIERIEGMGMAVHRDTFETAEWFGRFDLRWEDQLGTHAHYIYRREVKLQLCRSTRAKDANIRAALIDRFGGSKRAAVGLKKSPGPLYSVTAHAWSALAVVVAWIERQREKEAA